MEAKDYLVSWIIVNRNDSVKRYALQVSAYNEKDAIEQMRQSLKLYKGDLLREVSIIEIKSNTETS